jgi:hypothetical protein
MTVSIRVLFAVLAVCGAGLVNPAGAAQLISQPACAPNPCFSFANGISSPFFVRTFGFNAAKAGLAQVSFEGSLTCSIPQNLTGVRVVDFSTQIMKTGSSAPPNGSAVGGLRIARTFTGSAPQTDSFSLSTSRAMNLIAGSNAVSVLLNIHRMDSDVFCSVFNASFTVLLTP